LYYTAEIVTRPFHWRELPNINLDPIKRERKKLIDVPTLYSLCIASVSV
jgi:hypothetical protein